MGPPRPLNLRSSRDVSTETPDAGLEMWAQNAVMGVKGSAMPVSITVEGDEVVSRFRLDGDEGLSASKKTRIVASTRGNQPIEGTDVIVGLNAYRPVTKR